MNPTLQTKSSGERTVNLIWEGATAKTGRIRVYLKPTDGHRFVAVNTLQVTCRPEFKNSPERRRETDQGHCLKRGYMQETYKAFEFFILKLSLLTFMLS